MGRAGPYESQVFQPPVQPLGVFPRGAKADDSFRAKIVQLKRFLADLAPTANATFVDLGAQFLRPDGALPRELMGDFVHPTEQGYELWAAALRPLLQEAAGPATQPMR